MNFQSMEYFIMLAKERSFTKAAERLHITQQTLSAHISAIERQTENRRRAYKRQGNHSGYDNEISKAVSAN